MMIKQKKLVRESCGSPKREKNSGVTEAKERLFKEGEVESQILQRRLKKCLFTNVMFRRYKSIVGNSSPKATLISKFMQILHSILLTCLF